MKVGQVLALQEKAKEVAAQKQEVSKRVREAQKVRERRMIGTIQGELAMRMGAIGTIQGELSKIVVQKAQDAAMDINPVTGTYIEDPTTSIPVDALVEPDTLRYEEGYEKGYREGLEEGVQEGAERVTRQCDGCGAIVHVVNEHRFRETDDGYLCPRCRDADRSFE